MRDFGVCIDVEFLEKKERFFFLSLRINSCDFVELNLKRLVIGGLKSLRVR